MARSNKKSQRFPNTEQCPVNGLWRFNKVQNKGKPSQVWYRSTCLYESSEAAWTALQERMRAVAEHGAQAVAAAQAKPMPTLEGLARVWLTKVVPVTCKASTLTDYQVIVAKHLAPVLGPRPVDTITRGDIKTLLLGKVAEGYAASTVTHIKNALSGILALAVDDELLPANPALALGKLWKEKPAEKNINPFTPDELRALLGVLQERWPRYYPLVATLALAGLRAGEALALRWSDLDFERGLILVSRSLSRMRFETPKNGKSRRVDMAGGLATILLSHKAAQAREALANGWGKPELVFVNGSGGHVDVNPFRRGVWLKALSLAKLTGRRIHDLRHTYVTMRIAAGHDLADVSKQAGHHSIAFTDARYFHWKPGARSRAQVNELAESLGLGGKQ